MDKTLVHAACAATDYSSLSTSFPFLDELLGSEVSRLRAAGCVFAEEEAELILDSARRARARGEFQAADVDAMVARRCAGEPLEHVVGWAAFCGLRIAVAPGVFVPRRRTELLVEQALQVAGDASMIVDLCCGAGPVAAALAVRLPQAEIHATDIDPVQTAYARRNLELFAHRAHVHEGDLFGALPTELCGRVDLVVANAPYVPSAAIATLPTEAREYEPVHSLDGGSDGLAMHRRLAAGAGRWLAPGGHLLVETSERQSPHTRAVFAAAGLDAWVVECEEMEATVVVGRRLHAAEDPPVACADDRLSCSCPKD